MVQPGLMGPGTGNQKGVKIQGIKLLLRGFVNSVYFCVFVQFLYRSILYSFIIWLLRDFPNPERESACSLSSFGQANQITDCWLVSEMGPGVMWLVTCG